MTPLSQTKFWQHLNCGFFLHKKTSSKKMLKGLRLFLLQDYLHFKWCIMVFTSFQVYERFLILFVYIIVSLGFPWSPLTGASRFTHANPAGTSLVWFLVLHNLSLWAVFFSSIWLGSLIWSFWGASRKIKRDNNTSTHKELEIFHKPGNL